MTDGPAFDSAGIQVVAAVEGGPHEWEPAVAWQPSLSIGSIEGDADQLLHAVSMVRMLPDRRLVVAARHEIRVYTEDGRFSHALSGVGQGPGEFLQISSFAVCRDTLWLSGAGSLSLAAYSAEGSLFGTFRDSALPRDVSMRLHGCTARGPVVSLPTDTVHRSPQGTEFRTRALFQTDPVLNLQTALGSFRSSEGFGRLFLPFGRSELVGIADTMLLIVDSSRPEIRQFSVHDAALRRIVRLPLRADVISRAQRTAVVEWLEAGLRGVPDGDRLLADVRLPPEAPLFARLVVAQDGSAWLSQFQRHLPESERANLWFVVPASMDEVFRLELPPRFELHQVLSSGVVGVWYDPAGVPFIRMYEFDSGEERR